MRAVLRISIGAVLLGGIAAGFAFTSGRWPSELAWPFYLALIGVTVAGGAAITTTRGRSQIVVGGLTTCAIAGAWVARGRLIAGTDILSTFEALLNAFVVPSSFLPLWWPIPAALVFLTIALLAGDRGDAASLGQNTVRWGEPSTLPISPLHHASAAAVLGIVGTLFAGLTFFQKLVIVAPVFEELLKFGVALLISTILATRGLVGRFSLGLLVGLAFGVTEHFVTYASEPDILYLSRATFHACAAATSMTVYHVLANSVHVETRWGATIFSTVIHAANNLFAVVYGIALAVFGEFGFAPPTPPIGIVLGVALLGGNIVVLRHSARVRAAADQAVAGTRPAENLAVAHDL